MGKFIIIMLENNSSEEGREAMARTKATEELKKLAHKTGKLNFSRFVPEAGGMLLLSSELDAGIQMLQKVSLSFRSS
jgi:hypothetical protein